MNIRCNRYNILDGVLLVTAVAAVYGRLLWADFLSNWDDYFYVINNDAVHGFSWDHIQTVFRVGNGIVAQYNPLSLLSFMVDYSLWGLWPGGYHLTNIVIHAVNGLLLYRLFYRWSAERLFALLGSALFLLHPVQVESVAWVSERKGLLSLFFLLIAWEGYCNYREAPEGKGAYAYFVSLTAFLCSLLAKTTGVVLPLLLILYDWCFVADREKRVRIGDKVPFVIAAGAFSMVEILTKIPAEGGALIGYHGGSPLATFYTMAPVFCRYLGLLLWPAGLNIEHWPPVYRSLDTVVVCAFLLLAGVMYAGFRLFKADRKLGFWVMFFWIGLLPVSQIIPLILLMYEHYLYMPIIGVAALAGSAATCVRDKLGGRWSAVLYGLLAMWLLSLSVTSQQRTAVWKDSLTLFTDSAAKSPDGYRVWATLGEIYHNRGDWEAAKTALEKSLSLKGDSTDVLWRLADIYTETGELDKGFDYSKRVLALNPKYVRGWATLGNNYRDRGEYVKAKEMYNRALAIQPDAVEVQVMLAKLALSEKQLDDARRLLGGVELGGKDLHKVETAYLLACVESLAGHTDLALAWLEKALQRGYQDYYTLNTNRELSGIWNDPRFSYLMLRYFPNQANGR